MRESPFEFYINYFEGIANRHPQVKGFYPIDQEEILSGALRSKAQSPCLFLEFPDPNLFDNSTNTDIKIPSGLAVLQPLRKGDAEKLTACLVLTEKILLDMISRIRKDRKDGLFYMNTNELNYSKVTGMFGDNWTGWRLEFKYQKYVDLNFYPGEWDDYNPQKFK